jgi:hypothetical protein
MAINTLNVMLWVIVYVPLIILALWMIFGFFYYKAYEKVFTFIKTVVGYLYTGLVGLANLVRANPFLCLAFVTFVGTLVALGFIMNTGLPHWAGQYGEVFITVACCILAIGSLIGLYVIFNNKIRGGAIGGPPFPPGTDWSAFKNQVKWLGGRTKKYLWYSIVAGLAIALVLGTIYALVYVGNNSLLLNIVASIVGLGVIFFLYKLASSNTQVRHFIDNNIIFNLIYHLVFIIPCSFFYAANGLYKEFYNTPKFAYILLGLEILFLIGFFLIPIVIKGVYNFSFGKDGRKQSIESGIASLEQSLEYYKGLNSRLKSSPRVGWSKIIRQNLNSPKNAEELKNHLLVLGYKSEKDSKSDSNKLTLEDVTKYIHKTLPIILNNENSITDLEFEIKKKKAELKNLSAEDTGVTLLNAPIPLSTEKTIGTYENLGKRNKAHSTDFNYNYAIGCWVFIHNYGTNLSPAYVVDTPLLNYGNRPAIMYNGKTKELKIKMKNISNNLITVYKTNKIPLQRWVNIVVNYSGGTLDVFIDKKLVASERNIVPHMSYSKVTVGKDNGISGGICNVTYWSNVLTKNQIEIYYDLLKNKNPPVV